MSLSASKVHEIIKRANKSTDALYSTVMLSNDNCPERGTGSKSKKEFAFL